MPKWELHPFETAGDDRPETQIMQIDQEFEAIANKLQFLIAEKARLLEQIYGEQLTIEESCE